MNRNECLISTVIPNWNGLDLLARSIPKAIDALETFGEPYNIIVVDDCSSDRSVEWLKDTHPSVTVIERSINGGFSKAINTGLMQGNSRFVLCLNSDMELYSDSIDGLVHAFDKVPSLFAATMYIEFPPGRRQEESGWTYGIWQDNAVTFHHLTGSRPPEGLLIPVLYPGGGSSLYSREKIKNLGYFPEVYSPFYYEDSDVGFRAWSNNWPTVLVPESRAVHLHRGTIGRHFSQEYINGVLERNRVIFHLRNLPSGPRRSYVFRSWLRLLKGAVTGAREFPQAWSAAQRMASGSLPSSPSSLGFRDHRMVSVPYDQDVLGHPKDPIRTIDVVMLCAYNPFPPLHGGAVRMFNTTQSFVSMGLKLLLVIMTEQHDDEADIRMRAEAAGVGQQSLILIKRSGSPLDPRRPALETDFDEPALHSILQSVIASHQVSIAWAEYSQMGQYLRLFNSDTIKVLIAHDVASVSSWRQALIVPSIRFRLNRVVEAAKVFLYETDIARAADYVLTVNDRERDFLKRFARHTQIITSPTGMTLPAALSTEPTPGTVLFVGSLRHTPNVEGLRHFLSAVWPKVLARVPQTRLRVVGTPVPSDLQNTSDTSVTWVGRVDDVGEEYLRAWVSIVPIYVGAGIRIKILESLSYGVPVVSTKMAVEGLDDLRPGRDLLVCADDDAMVNSLVSVLGDKNLRHSVGTNGSRAVANFYEWTAIIKKTLEEIRP